MAMTSIASQLQAIKSLVQADYGTAKRPFTRPSLLFDPKEAADLDLDTIFSIGLSGLDVLLSIDEKFRNYKNDLFSHKSRELDRELLSPEENNRINASIGSFLRLISGHLHLPSAIKTLEYLIRRYKIHVYNFEDLILCALPFHDTHVFVRIVQLLDLGNSKWKFLAGVKVSGAPPPRNVIVQQCIRDMGILEVLCNYASPEKKYQPSSVVVSFCTAVLVETLGSVTTIDSDCVKRIMPFIVSGLQPSLSGSQDHKAGALMIVGLLANKVTLSPKLVKSLIGSVSEIAREDGKDSTDLQWFRLSLMALINLVQLQSVDMLPKRVVEILKERSDLAGVLLSLAKEFNIDQFLTVLLDSLADYSSDELCRLSLISILETVPLNHLVDRVVLKMLFSCMKLSEKLSNSSPESGHWAKQILVIINQKYPSELHAAVGKFFKDKKVRTKKEDLVVENLCRMLDGKMDLSLASSDSKIWFTLDHPKAEVRCAALSGLDKSSILEACDSDSHRLVVIQDAILHQLHDDDLTVIKAALSVDGLSELVNPPDLLQALNDILQRCIAILKSASHDITLATEIAISCLELSYSCLHHDSKHAKTIATMLFPLLLVLPKTKKLNLKALELSRGTTWPLYCNIVGASCEKTKLSDGSLSAVNVETIKSLAETFIANPKEFMPWLIEICIVDTSKTLFYLVMLQSLSRKHDLSNFAELFETCFAAMKTEWDVSIAGNFISTDEFNKEMINWDLKAFLAHLVGTKLKAITGNILVCVFWRLVEAFISTVPADNLLANEYEGHWDNKFEDLFSFFASAQPKHVFKEHLLHLVTRWDAFPVGLLMKFFTAEDVPIVVQEESLHCFSILCSKAEDGLPLQLFEEFPSLLVPLVSQSQDLRLAAMKCIEGLYALWGRVDLSRRRTEIESTWINFLEELLHLVAQQKRLILSDRNFLPTFFTSMLGSSCQNLLIHKNIEQSFNESAQEDVLAFILCSSLKLSSYGKLVILSMLKGVGGRVMLIKDIRSLLSNLLKQHSQYCLKLDKTGQKLSKNELEILCLLLECCAVPTSDGKHAFKEFLFDVLQLHGSSQDHPFIAQPCITVLQKLNTQLYSTLETEMQEKLFLELVILFWSASGEIQNATKEAFLRLKVDSSIISKVLDHIINLGGVSTGVTHGRKKRKEVQPLNVDIYRNVIEKGGNVLPFISSLLDVLLLNKDIENRNSLIGPLFKLLRKVFSDNWLNGDTDQNQRWTLSSSGVSQTVSSTLTYIQQTLLLILEDICSALLKNKMPVDKFLSLFDIKLLVDCARSSKDGVTRNHTFSLISAVAKICPDKVLTDILDIVRVIGESTVVQVDNHSQHVFEDLISALVPCWLSKSDNTENLLQIFIDILPEVAGHRRLPIVLFLIRTLGESSSLASLILLLFRSLVSRKGLSSSDSPMLTSSSVTSVIRGEWEYGFAMQICEQYPCSTWLPSLVLLLQQFGSGKQGQEMLSQLLIAMQFTSFKLQDPEFSLKLEVGKDSDDIQTILRELMDQAIRLSQLVELRSKQTNTPVAIRKELKQNMRAVLRTLARVMTPSAYFQGIINLLSHEEKDVTKKALDVLCETIKNRGDVIKKQEGRRKSKLESKSLWFRVDESTLQAFGNMCLKIVQLIDNSVEDLEFSIKLSAISAIEVLATSFPIDSSVFCNCLASISRNIGSANISVGISCLRAGGALVNLLGLKALPELPLMMENVLRMFCNASSHLNVSAVSSLLITLEAVIDNLGHFLNPYLDDIIELMVLRPQFFEADPKLNLKADTIRKLITQKIPIRLTLPHLLKLYLGAVNSGDSSLVLSFEMLADLVKTMDRLSISAYHVQIFDLCLAALDLRRKRPSSVQKVEVVEERVISTIVSLTMKLTETMFKPLFIKGIEWAELDADQSANKEGENLDRTLSFYALVNKLAESHRSLFVPYFKYLLESCVQYLSNSVEAVNAGLKRKKKKVKLQNTNDQEKGGNTSLSQWHVRALVISSLHKCFLYDTGNKKFLESSNFQILLKPIVSQLVVEQPDSVEDHPEIPSVMEVDDMLVSCIGQMAVAAGSDPLWKPLNHEVLLQTRSEKVRARILGLRIVRKFLENLKEEYLVLLAETIPFLGELLEDVEPSVKSLAQEILREMESMSGESLRQYL